MQNDMWLVTITCKTKEDAENIQRIVRNTPNMGDSISWYSRVRITYFKRINLIRRIFSIRNWLWKKWEIEEVN